MARDWNPAQREALSVRGRDTLVCAAAGSGKTAVLCQRILDRITDSENPLLQVCCLMFMLCLIQLLK